MSSQRQGPSHCVVQWDDNNIEYAIVDVQRAKTVSALKIGSTTLFCGDNRTRRRGKILFMGMSPANWRINAQETEAYFGGDLHLVKLVVRVSSPSRTVSVDAQPLISSIASHFL